MEMGCLTTQSLFNSSPTNLASSENLKPFNKNKNVDILMKKFHNFKKWLILEPGEQWKGRKLQIILKMLKRTPRLAKVMQ